MTQTTARLKRTGKDFEIMVDMEKALAFRKTGVDNGFLEYDRIFSDSKKGFAASGSDMKKVFGTDDTKEIANKIVKEGEILVTQEHRSEEQKKKLNQVVDFISKNAIDPQSGLPHTPERIKTALEQAHVNIKNIPIENQINEILEQVSKIIPLRIETRKVKITIPAVHTGRVYGIITEYKENENWLNNGDLEMVVNVPSGILIDFYDKLNNVTHGSALTQEIKG